MKAYFTQLFNYDNYANQLVSNLIKANPLPQTMRLMAHLLAAQQVWLSRCNGTSNTEYTIWPEGDVDTFDGLINDNHHQWISYLEELGNADFDQGIAYKNSQGTEFTNKLVDILTHVINHGTHHRAQIGNILKSAGNEGLPNTDFIFYLRQ
jgi:uncharacterized damage-inducible protein DinB